MQFSRYAAANRLVKSAAGVVAVIDFRTAEITRIFRTQEQIVVDRNQQH